MNLPLSFAQERLWFLDRLTPGLAVYNQPLALALAGPLAVPAWRQCLTEIARRHEILRTSFPEIDGRPVQRIAPAGPAGPAGEVTVPVADLAGLPAGARRQEAERLTNSFARRPFDLAAGPLFRAALLRLAAEDWIALLNLHHTIADGASLALLLGELAALYPGIASRPSPLSELPLQYADYAVWQRRWRSGEALAPQLDGWRRELAGLPELLPLPTDRPRPAVQSFRGGQHLGRLPAGPTAELARLGRERGATLFMVLLAALLALLHRLTGETDLAVGSPVDARDRTELEELIGLFVNTLVLRGRVDGDENFPALLARTRKTALAAYARQELPFEALVAELPVRTDLARNPLFQILLAFQHEGTAPPELPGLGTRLLDLDLGGSRVDLGLSIEGLAGGLTLALEHSSDLFDRPTAGRLLGRYLTLLAGVATIEGRPIAGLPLLDAAERHQLLIEWKMGNSGDAGDTGASVEPLQPVHHLFARQAESTPDAVAVVGPSGESLTYAELDRRAGRLARRLRRLGVGPEARVGLLAEPSPDLVIGWLGIWKAGAAVLPLDPTQPDARLARFLAGEPILTPPGLATRAATLAAPGAAVVLLQEPVGAESAGEGHPADVHAGDLAYLIFTSGTTGQPKGVMVEHKSLAHTLAACRAAFGSTTADRLPVLAAAGFDIFLFELLLPLLEGGTAVLFARRPTLDLAALAAQLPGMTLLHAVPALMRQLVLEVARTQGTCGSLRRVFVGGDAVPGDLLVAMRQTFPAARVTVLYGPTEGTILAAAWEVEGEVPEERKPLGRPLPGVDLGLQDPRGEPVPIGLAGELWIGGPGVARGYRGQPERTAERFVPAPGGGQAGGTRVYRTGDLARFLPSGRLEFLGRVDQQLKVRGFRIEPGEVEAALRSHPAVGEAAVMAREDGFGGPRLAAFLVAAPGSVIGLPERAEIAEHVRQRLPAYMVPAQWSVLPALPLTAHGKIDRRALAEVAVETTSVFGGSGAGGAPGDAPPETPTEELLAGIWAALLGIERVGRHDSFFDLGGHSLLATQAISRVRDALGVELPVRALFEAPTPALLAREVERARAAPVAEAEPAPPLVPVGRDRPLPLSFAQERLWLLDQIQPGSAYNLPFALDLTGPLDVAAWMATWDEVRLRHEVLRTHFRPLSGTEGGAVQEIAPPASAAFAALPLVDLTPLPEKTRRAEAARLAAAEARRPFDLAAGPLVRAFLLRLAPEEHREILNLHHAVADAWSMGVLFAELQGIYGAFAAGRPAPFPALPPLPIQYADYAVWQRRWLSGPVLARQLAYWRERLSGDRPLALPIDHPERENPGHPGAVHRTILPAGLGRALLAWGRERGATLFMTLFAGFAALLGRLAEDGPAGRADVTLGTPIANRGRTEVAGLIGFFVNTLALRVGLAGDPGFAALLGRVREAALGAYDHQDLPFEKLVRELRPERRPDENPLFDVAFSLNRPLPGFAVSPESEGTGLTLTPGEIYPGTAKFRLALALTDGPAGLATAWEYRADLFDAPTIARLARAWEVLLASLADLADIADRPERPWSEIPLLAEGERHQVTREWNDTASPYPRDATLPEIFARQVARYRDAVALAAGGESLTYGELDRRAAALARHLEALGVGPEVPVALPLPRGFDLIVGILGILQAGGAYVPLDPDHPAERLGFLLADTGVKVVLTHGALAERLPLSGQEVVDLDLRDLDDRGARAAGGVRPGLAPENLAYILYTSGSTGVPKGVAVTHRNVLRLVLGTEYARFGPAEVFLQLAPVPFDASTFEIWGALLHGGRLVLAPPGRASLHDIARVIEDFGVTTLWLTAGLFHQMVDEELAALAGVRQLLAGGDIVASERARAALTGLPGTVLIDGYGPTEGTTFSCCERLADPAEIGGTIPIGRPIRNTRAHVLDRSFEPAPVGVPGELYLGGDGLARGYLGRPDGTAERFLPDPFAVGSRLYRTGDRVRLRPDGRLDFLGRTDLQVKMAGHRVEPGEIEAALARHPGVRESAVVAQPASEPSDPRLVAYVVPAAGTSWDEPELRAWLRARLPEPLLPHRFVILDRLPLTANGKVDRAALPLPGPGAVEKAAHEAAGSATGAPRTPTAEILAGLWADLLDLPRVDPVDPDADFFALGGHSLLGTRLLAQIRRTFAVDLPLRALFEAPTVAGLARRIDERRRSGGAAVRPAFPRLPRQSPAGPAGPAGDVEIHPVSLAQRRLWLVDRLNPGGFFLNVAHGLRLAGDLSIDLLQESLREIVARHEPLRTTFTTVDGQPMQRIALPGPFDLPLADLSGLPAGRRESTARAAGQALAEHPADLARGPLFRAALLRLAPAEHQLLLVPHHLIFDGVSRGILFRELEALYGAFSREQPPRLKALPVRYAEFAHWQRQVLAGPALAAERAWWRRQLAGLPALDLPTDHPRPPVQRFGGGFRTRMLPDDLVADLLALCRRQGVTLFMALLALFETLLARATGQTDFPVGAPVAGRGDLDGRDEGDISGLLGFFVNTLVLRADLAGEPTFAGLLARTRETALDAYAHQDLPFEILVEELRPERHLDANPLFDVALSLDEPPPLPDLRGLAVAPLDRTGDAAHFDLLLIATRDPSRPTGLALTLNHRRDLYEAATAERLLAQLTALLERAVAAPDTPALDLSPWSEAAWQQVTREWNDTAAAGSPLTAYERFAEQARTSPAALALAGPGLRLTYGELDRRANGLAGRLRQLGIGGDGGGGGGRVALGFDRSPELVLAALAAWKAGAAYLPLDPAAPPERLASMVADAGASLVLIHREGAERFAACAARTLFLDEETVESAATPPRESVPQAGEIAYVIYTSGSTGRPKGVEVSHGALANLVAWALPRFRMSADDRSSLVTSPAFDASVWDLWVNLAAGASLHAPPREIAVSPRELLSWLAAERLTTCFLPTPLAHGVLHQEQPAGLALRHLFAGGDRLRQAPPAGWELTLVNAYGPTECTVMTTSAELLPGDPGIPSIGRPIGGAEVYLLDSALRPVPPGGRGEVAIGGAGLARGYAGRPERTAERFVPHPFSPRPGSRLYLTGDLARHLANGEIEFLGRADGQVKVRGFRVEMGEIEVELGRHPALREAVVVRRDDPILGATLVAYVVPVSPSEGAPEGAELRRFLAARVPEYMLPAAFISLPALPLNTNGKVDRRALPPPPFAPLAREEGSAGEAPASELERTIARLWCEVLHLGSVSARDNFFDLGGQSLAMVAVHEKLQAALGIEFPLVEMFESPTTRALAARLARRTEERTERQDFNRRAVRQREATAWKEQARQARRIRPPRPAGPHL